MRKILVSLALVLVAMGVSAQTGCVSGSGVTCSPNLNLWILPYAYANWNVATNANATELDTWSATALLKAGGTMTGPLILSADPTAALGAATKQYVDGKVGGVTSFAAPAASWPTWLVPTVATSTTTPSLTVAASAIPNSALANPTLVLGATTLTLGATTTAVTGLTIDGVLPAVMAYVDPTSSIQTQLNSKAAKGANSDITSLSGLTTPLTTGQGGIGVAGGTGYAYGNGLLAFSFSTTIPVGSVTGAAPTASPTFTGTVTMPFGAAGLVTTTAGGVLGTSSVSLTGAGAAVPTGPATSTSTDIVTFSGVSGQIADSGTLLSSLAPLASPTFTGTPAAPTPGSLINTTQIPTTAYLVTYYAPLASPTFTGTPAAPTAALNTNTTQIATTAFVEGEVVQGTNCGTGTTCTVTSLTPPFHFVFGSATLSGGTATVTGIPAFTSTSNATCWCQDTTSPLQACGATLATTASVTLSGNATDVNKYMCFGD